MLVLGILSLLCCGLLGPFAWVIGGRARKQMDGQPQVVWTNRGNITAGWVLGIISTVLLVGSILFYVVVIGALASGNG